MFGEQDNRAREAHQRQDAELALFKRALASPQPLETLDNRTLDEVRINGDRLLGIIKDAQRRPQPIDTLHKRAASEPVWQPLPDVDGLDVQFNADGSIRDLRLAETAEPEPKPDEEGYAEKMRQRSLELIKQVHRAGGRVTPR